MTWTYRIIRDTDGIYRIAEVYNGPPNIVRWTAKPCYPIGEDTQELRNDIRMMLKAFERPVLDEATLRETIKLQTPEG